MLSPACLGRLSLTVPSLHSVSHLRRGIGLRTFQWQISGIWGEQFNMHLIVILFYSTPRFLKIHFSKSLNKNNRNQDSVVLPLRNNFVYGKDSVKQINFS